MTVVFDLPAHRPAGLRRPRAIDVTLTRVDTTDPAGWSWEGFAQPYHRFHPVAGGFRVRYAGWTPRAALRDFPSDVSREVTPTCIWPHSAAVTDVLVRAVVGDGFSVPVS